MNLSVYNLIPSLGNVLPVLDTRVKFNIQIGLGSATDVNLQKMAQRVIALAADQPSYRLLVVDDELENRKLLFKLLSSVGRLAIE